MGTDVSAVKEGDVDGTSDGCYVAMTKQAAIKARMRMAYGI